MKKIMVLAFVFPLLLISLAQAGQLSGKVTKILSGDTLKINVQGKEWKIRLAGITCPNLRQPNGQQARKLTRKIAFGKRVVIKPKGMDRYGATVGEVILPNGSNLGHELVKAGLGRYSRTSPK